MGTAGKTWKRKPGKTGGRDFKPGNPGGPGRPKIPADLKAAAEFVQNSRAQARALWSAYYDELVNLSYEDLRRLTGYRSSSGKEVPPPSDIPVLKLMVARAIQYAARTGKGAELSTHRELMCGPEQKQVNLAGHDGGELLPLGNYSQPQLVGLFTALDGMVKEIECRSTQNSPPSSALPPPSLPPGSGTAS